MADIKKAEDKPKVSKQVIAFYKNTEKSGWQMFPSVCRNEETARKRIGVLCDPAKVSFVAVPEYLING